MRTLRAIMRYLIALLLLLNVTAIFACDCKRLDSTNINEWIDWADIIVEGTFVSILNPYPEQRERLKNETSGDNILLKVTNVIKGSVNTNEIAILQFNNGDCTQVFKSGTKYIVFGSKVNRIVFEDHTIKYEESDEYEILTEIPSPEPLEQDESGTLKTNFYTGKSLDYWNSITIEYTTISTSMCSTFIANSKTGMLIKEN